MSRNTYIVISALMGAGALGAAVGVDSEVESRLSPPDELNRYLARVRAITNARDVGYSIVTVICV